MAEKRKYYVVWEGRQPGVYDNWEDCKEQVFNYPKAKYMSFKSQTEAIMAFRGDGHEEENLLTLIALKNTEANATAPQSIFDEQAPAGNVVSAMNPTAVGNQANVATAAGNGAPSEGKGGGKTAPRVLPLEVNPAAIAVDGACAGNPGLMEYRGVKVATGEEIFHIGPLTDGTNNVAEYLALIHALALLFRQNDSTTPIYTDSKTAVAWVRNRGCRTQLKPTERNRKIFEMLARANIWIQTHTITNPILRWNTPLWGEIPADFGRK
jgi:ribonuclease HI